MARIIIETNDGHQIDVLTASNQEGPWTDDDTLDAIVWSINAALTYEGDEA